MCVQSVSQDCGARSATCSASVPTTLHAIRTMAAASVRLATRDRGARSLARAWLLDTLARTVLKSAAVKTKAFATMFPASATAHLATQAHCESTYSL